MNPQASYSPICGGSDWNSTPDVNLLYLYDGWNLIAEMDATSTPVVARSYAWGTDLSGTLEGAGGVGGLLMANLGDGNTTQMVFYGCDGNGNVNALVDTSGNLVGTYDYDAFGKIVQVSGDWASYNLFKFSTKYAETNAIYGGSGLGLVYYGYRFYNLEMGRFLNRDPLDEAGGINLYAMCRNNMANSIDYLGGLLWMYRYMTIVEQDKYFNAILKTYDKSQGIEDGISHFFTEWDKLCSLRSPSIKDLLKMMDPELSRALISSFKLNQANADLADALYTIKNNVKRIENGASKEIEPLVFNSANLYRFVYASAYNPITKDIAFSPAVFNEQIDVLAGVIVHELFNKYCQGTDRNTNDLRWSENIHGSFAYQVLYTLYD